MSSLFSLPLPNYQQYLREPESLQVNSKKRKRRQSVNQKLKPIHEIDDDLHYLSEEAPATSSQSLEYSAVLTPEERTQYRTAGQPFDEKPPSFPFPHSASKIEKSATPRTAFDVRHRKPAPVLHLQHLSVMTAVLHRCLAAQDYSRASRALGIILRDSVGGQAIDIRNQGRWGIGAEILLREGTPHEHSLEETTPNAKILDEAPCFTVEGFQRAKLYYERLIVQYPFNKQHSGSVNALDFYQALFGLWIYIVHEQNKTQPSLSPGSISEERSERELEQAREIAGRMDACMSSVPFCDDLELIRLRGMVALWTADLATSCIRSTLRNKDRSTMDTECSPVDNITSDVSQIALQDRRDSDSMSALQLEATQARRAAHQMFSRLQGDASLF